MWLCLGFQHKHPLLKGRKQGSLPIALGVWSHVADRLVFALARIEEKSAITHASLKIPNLESSEDDGDKHNAQSGRYSGRIRKLVVIFAPVRLRPLRMRL